MNGVGVISTQASVTIQCTQDIQALRDRVNLKPSLDNIVYHWPLTSVSAEITNIRTKELVYHCYSTSRKSRGAVPVQSILNGLYVHGKATEQAERLEKLSLGIRFIGVACTPTNLGDATNNQSQLTVRTRGTETIMNTGNVDIKVGDIIVWKVPTKEEWNSFVENLNNRRGQIPAYDTENEENRVLLMTIPYRWNSDHTDAKGENPLEISVQDYDRNKAGKDTKETVQALNNLMKEKVNTEVNRRIHQFESRKIGKALSSAMPGCPFDILLY